jgi:ribosomal protein S9
MLGTVGGVGVVGAVLVAFLALPQHRDALAVLGDLGDAWRMFPHWGIDAVLEDAAYCAFSRWTRATAKPSTSTASAPLVVVYHTDADYARGVALSAMSLARAVTSAPLQIDVHVVGGGSVSALHRQRMAIAAALSRRMRALGVDALVTVRVFITRAKADGDDAAPHERAPHLGAGAPAAAARARLDVLAQYAATASRMVAGSAPDYDALIWMLDADTLYVPSLDAATLSINAWANASLPRDRALAAVPMPEHAVCEFATGATLFRPAHISASDVDVMRRIAQRAPLGDHDALNALYGSRQPDCSGMRGVLLGVDGDDSGAWRMNVYGLGERERRGVNTDRVLWEHVLRHTDHRALLQWSGPCKPWMLSKGGRACAGAEHAYSLWNTDVWMRTQFAGAPAPTVVAAFIALCGWIAFATATASYSVMRDFRHDGVIFDEASSTQ